MSLDPAIDVVVQAIGKAFAGVERGAITLHEAEAIDSYSTEAQRAKARKRDQESTWEAIADADVLQCSNALPHLDPKSWRYYMPCFMVWTLRHHQTSHALAVDQTIYALMLTNDDGSINRYLRERYETLAPAQKLAVRDFLRCMSRPGCRADREAAQTALDRYWNRF